MEWSLSSLTSRRRPSPETRRAPKHKRSLILEDLEGRLVLSQGIQPIATLSTAGTSNMISGPDGDLWVGMNPSPSSAAVERIGLDGSVTSFPVPVPGNATVANFGIVSVTTGPDGNVWFDADFDPSSSDNQVVIGAVTPSGTPSEAPSSTPRRCIA